MKKRFAEDGVRLTDCCGGEGDGGELEKIPVTGGAKSLPVFDMDGNRIRLGDTLEVQHCVGKYGQTKIERMTVTESFWNYFQHGVARACWDSKSGKMICRYVHNDFEHGHETFARIVT